MKQDQSKVLILGIKSRVAARSNAGSITVIAYGSPSINAMTLNDKQLSKLAHDSLTSALTQTCSPSFHPLGSQPRRGSENSDDL